MSDRRFPWMWIAGVAMGIVMIGGQNRVVHSAESSPTATVVAEPPAASIAPPASAATTISVVPAVLVGTVKGGSPEPPPVRPLLRPTPASGGPVTLAGKVPEDVKVTIPALSAYGKGDIEITGDMKLRFSGDGSLWVDKASSVSLDPATTGTKTIQDDGWSWDRFRGTARVAGSSLRLKAKGERLVVYGEGQGTISLRGEGMFRIMQAGGKLVSGVWNQAGVTQDFAKVAIESTTGTVQLPIGKSSLPPHGILPDSPPPLKVIPRKSLPSEAPPTGAAPTLAPPAPPVQPTTPTAPAK